MIRGLFLVLAALVALCAEAQNTSRRHLKTTPTVSTSKTEVYSDSVVVTPGVLSPFGFEKTLRSRTESFFLTNNTADTIAGISFAIDYLDLSDRQLHSRQLRLPCSIPPGETRRLDFPTWDKQQVWYYYLSPSPRRGTQATSFKVRLNITHYYLPRRD